MTSMANRDLTDLDPMVYACGFPCKPCPAKTSFVSQSTTQTQTAIISFRYSRLRRDSKLMQEDEAQPFWDSLAAMLRSHPFYY